MATTTNGTPPPRSRPRLPQTLPTRKKRPENITFGRLASSPADSRNSVEKPQIMKSKSVSAGDARSKDKAAEEIFEANKVRMGTLTFGGKEERQVHAFNSGDIENKGKIGAGVTGEVYRVVHKPTGKMMAAKKMLWMEEKEERKRVLMDLNVMSIHKSPHIVKYYGSAIWNNEVWVFMELMTTSLDRLFWKLAGPIPEDIVCKMAVSIVKALNYLKTEHSVIHRDVKPSNMLLDREGNVKLCDFGISGRLVDSQAFTRGAGCAAFMAPERINLKQSGYDIRADVWSLGISLVQLVTGSIAYSDMKFGTEFELLTHIVQAPPPLPNKDDFSPQFYDFLSQCLTKDFTVRPHYNELLEHPLIKEYEVKPVDVGAWLRDVEKTVGL